MGRNQRENGQGGPVALGAGMGGVPANNQPLPQGPPAAIAPRPWVPDKGFARPENGAGNGAQNPNEGLGGVQMPGFTAPAPTPGNGYQYMPAYDPSGTYDLLDPHFQSGSYTLIPPGMGGGAGGNGGGGNGGGGGGDYGGGGNGSGGGAREGAQDRKLFGVEGGQGGAKLGEGGVGQDSRFKLPYEGGGGSGEGNMENMPYMPPDGGQGNQSGGTGAGTGAEDWQKFGEGMAGQDSGFKLPGADFGGSGGLENMPGMDGSQGSQGAGAVGNQGANDMQLFGGGGFGQDGGTGGAAAPAPTGGNQWGIMGSPAAAGVSSLAGDTINTTGAQSGAALGGGAGTDAVTSAVQGGRARGPLIAGMGGMGGGTGAGTGGGTVAGGTRAGGPVAAGAGMGGGGAAAPAPTPGIGGPGVVGSPGMGGGATAPGLSPGGGFLPGPGGGVDPGLGSGAGAGAAGAGGNWQSYDRDEAFDRNKHGGTEYDFHKNKRANDPLLKEYTKTEWDQIPRSDREAMVASAFEKYGVRRAVDGQNAGKMYDGVNEVDQAGNRRGGSDMYRPEAGEAAQRDASPGDVHRSNIQDQIDRATGLGQTGAASDLQGKLDRINDAIKSGVYNQSDKDLDLNRDGRIDNKDLGLLGSRSSSIVDTASRSDVNSAAASLEAQKRANDRGYSTPIQLPEGDNVDSTMLQGVIDKIKETGGEPSEAFLNSKGITKEGDTYTLGNRTYTYNETLGKMETPAQVAARESAAAATTGDQPIGIPPVDAAAGTDAVTDAVQGTAADTGGGLATGSPHSTPIDPRDEARARAASDAAGWQDPDTRGWFHRQDTGATQGGLAQTFLQPGAGTDAVTDAVTGTGATQGGLAQTFLQPQEGATQGGLAPGFQQNPDDIAAAGTNAVTDAVQGNTGPAATTGGATQGGLAPTFSQPQEGATQGTGGDFQKHNERGAGTQATQGTGDTTQGPGDGGASGGILSTQDPGGAATQGGGGLAPTFSQPQEGMPSFNNPYQQYYQSYQPDTPYSPADFEPTPNTNEGLIGTLMGEAQRQQEAYNAATAMTDDQIRRLLQQREGNVLGFQGASGANLLGQAGSREDVASDIASRIGASSLQNVMDLFDKRRAGILSSATNRGMGNTTMLDSMLQGATREEAKAMTDAMDVIGQRRLGTYMGTSGDRMNLAERLAGQKTGLLSGLSKDKSDFLERIDRQPPNQQWISSLIEKAGAGGLGVPTKDIPYAQFRPYPYHYANYQPYPDYSGGGVKNPFEEGGSGGGGGSNNEDNRNEKTGTEMRAETGYAVSSSGSSQAPVLSAYG